MWTCPKCSKKVDDAYEICWACGTTVDGVEDPHFLDEPSDDLSGPGEIPENLVTVTKHLMGPEAHAMRARLESEGIPVFIFDEMTTTVGLLSNTATKGVQIYVAEPHVARAREILGIIAEEEEVDNEDELENDEEMDEDQQDDMSADEGITDKERLGDIPLDQGITDKPNEP